MGCRRRAAKSDLLRVVARREGAGCVLVPDPFARLPGRGAYVHHDPGCVDLAERRFGRAFRLPGPFDARRVREFVAEQQQHDGEG